jgi:hypothetical protein
MNVAMEPHLKEKNTKLKEIVSLGFCNHSNCPSSVKAIENHLKYASTQNTNHEPPINIPEDNLIQ